MGAIKLGRYAGRANSPFGVKWFFKPSLGKVVGRLPGVNRKSEKVTARNEEIRKSPPASKCEGLSWDEFTACLAKNM